MSGQTRLLCQLTRSEDSHSTFFTAVLFQFLKEIRQTWSTTDSVDASLCTDSVIQFERVPHALDTISETQDSEQSEDALKNISFTYMYTPQQLI